jgi:hypothetical protein
MAVKVILWKLTEKAREKKAREEKRAKKSARRKAREEKREKDRGGKGRRAPSDSAPILLPLLFARPS